MADILKKWKCNDCSEAWDKEYEAERCCPPTAIYICPECTEVYTKMVEAEECIKEHGKERLEAGLPEELPPTAEELESAGQLRLIG